MQRASFVLCFSVNLNTTQAPASVRDELVLNLKTLLDYICTYDKDHDFTFSKLTLFMSEICSG
jgi:hypothetical protein